MCWFEVERWVRWSRLEVFISLTMQTKLIKENKKKKEKRKKKKKKKKKKRITPRATTVS
jgi:hypothetical protein